MSLTKTNVLMRHTDVIDYFRDGYEYFRMDWFNHHFVFDVVRIIFVSYCSFRISCFYAGVYNVANWVILLLSVVL